MKSFSAESLLSLYSIPGIGSSRMRKLVGHFGSPENVLDAGSRELCRVKGMDQKIISALKAGPDRSFVSRQIDLMDRHSVHLISYWDDHYPARLKRIYDAPVLLFFKGNPECLNRKALAIVGTRAPTSYGKQVTEQFSTELAKAGFVIISGLARGVDTIVHRTVVRYGGITIGVLGGGIDWFYPSENKALSEEMMKNGGILTEHPMGTKPEPSYFPRRNRIISGLSLGVLITEAGQKSGALITAFNALEQDREVFAVPGPVYSDQSKGTNRMINEGAKLVQSIRDITEELSGQAELFDRNAQEVIQPMPKLEPAEQNVYDMIGTDPVHIDSIAQRTNLSTPEALTVLLSLELSGMIRQIPGKRFIRAWGAG